MELLTHRYRNLTVLVLVLVVQLLLLGYQVKNQQEVRLIRVWAVTAVMPVTRIVEVTREKAASVLRDYVELVGVRRENIRMKEELGKLKLRTRYLENELARADRALALSIFQQRSPSKTLAARIIGAGTGADSRVVFLDRGSSEGIKRGMAVITPDGIVGRVSAAYPAASQVVLVTDPNFAAGVVSQKHHVQGTLKGQGRSACIVDYVRNEEKVDPGEWFFTSGDDRVFPRGLPVGPVLSVRKGKVLKQIYLTPSGMRKGLEDVLVVLEGVHEPVPPLGAAGEQADLLSPPPPETETNSPSEQEMPVTPHATDADRLIEQYRKLGEAQGHVFGTGKPGSPALDATGGLEPAPGDRAAAPAPAPVTVPPRETPPQ